MMAVITNLNTYPVVPSDVFGFEVNTDVGYGRETFTLTLADGKTARVGTVMVVDYLAKTATKATTTDAEAPEGKEFAIYVGHDLTTNPATYADFDRLTSNATSNVVGITRGDGRGTLYKFYLDFDGTGFYSLPDASQKAMFDHFTRVNRFKVLDQVVVK